MKHYTYTMQHGWQDGPERCAALDTLDRERLGAWLYQNGYRILAQNGRARCNIGHFELWHHPEPWTAFPRYLVDIDQVGDETAVWIETLQDVWEFLRLYSSIGLTMSPHLPGDGVEEEDAWSPRCPDCGEPLTRIDPDGPGDRDHAWDA